MKSGESSKSIAAGASGSTASDSRLTQLHIAAKAGRHQEIKTLLEGLSQKEKEELISAKAVFGVTPLHIAAQTGRHQVIEKLLEGFSQKEKEKLISAESDLGLTALHSAVLYGNNAPTVEALCSHGAEIESKLTVPLTGEEKSCIEYAIKNNKVDIANVLFEIGANVDNIINIDQDNLSKETKNLLKKIADPQKIAERDQKIAERNQKMHGGATSSQSVVGSGIGITPTQRHRIEVANLINKNTTRSSTYPNPLTLRRERAEQLDQGRLPKRPREDGGR